MYSGNLEERASVLLGRHAGAEHRQLDTYSDVGQPITLEICTDPASDPCLQMIDQYRANAGMPALNMRH
eukprot:8883937-Karenia_brevis.AAC.1